MILMSELLEDPAYRRFLERLPDESGVAYDKTLQRSRPWVVLVQRESGGPWGKREFWKYRKALKFLLRAVEHHRVHDATIYNKRVYTPLPNKRVRIRGKFVVGSDGVKRQATTLVPWKPRIDADDEHHDWCGYCRRPTVFKHYSRHRRLGAVILARKRCCICGTSEDIASARSSLNSVYAS